MTAGTELDLLLHTLDPVLNRGVFAFVRGTNDAVTDASRVVAFIRESEGLSLVVEESYAIDHGLDVVFRCAWITLTVHSDLAAVGLTAAVSAALGRAGISCNVVAGVSHDHLFVPVEDSVPAMQALAALQRQARTSARHRTGS
ncbi:MAG: ACT domain-containing protein [Gemmatimonadetes bacterium]|nr:ACT domain-containing protein [Gemmatimonadota bacterium]